MTQTPRLRKSLTDLSIKALKPAKERYEVPDPDARGLRVVVQPSGRKAYAVRYRNAAGRARKLTLKAGITLAAARKLAADAMLEVAQGNDPAVGKQKASRVARARADDTVKVLAEQFIEQYAKRKTRRNSWRGTEGIFKNHVLPEWGARSIHEITRRDVIDLVEGLAVKYPTQANRMHAALSKFFKWLCQRDVLATSPFTGIDRPTQEKPRERVLSDSELVRLWRACDEVDPHAGACVRMLILTGQRRSEIAKLTWGEIGGDQLELPAERMKGKRMHLVPLSTQARTIIANMPRLEPRVPRPQDRVFGQLFGRIDTMKRKLDRHMDGTPHWTLHDIRRSTASGMAKLGVAVPTIEKIMAHRKGMLGGITGTYVRHSFLPEMQSAMQAWGDYVEALVGDKEASAKVARIR